MTQISESRNLDRKEDSVDANVGVGISSQLKKFYSSIQEEEIPDRLLTLLEKLEEAERMAASQVATEESVR